MVGVTNNSTMLMDINLIAGMEIGTTHSMGLVKITKVAVKVRAKDTIVLVMININTVGRKVDIQVVTNSTVDTNHKVINNKGIINNVIQNKVDHNTITIRHSTTSEGHLPSTIAEIPAMPHLYRIRNMVTSNLLLFKILPAISNHPAHMVLEFHLPCLLLHPLVRHLLYPLNTPYLPSKIRTRSVRHTTEAIVLTVPCRLELTIAAPVEERGVKQFSSTRCLYSLQCSQLVDINILPLRRMHRQGRIDLPRAWLLSRHSDNQAIPLAHLHGAHHQPVYHPAVES